ncbi:MAG: hypothetical protein WCP55_03860, partial [Lentisphaerota bacterium]
MSKRGKKHRLEVKQVPFSSEAIIRTLKIVDGRVKITISPHFVWQILSRKLVENLSNDGMMKMMLDSYVIPCDQRPQNLMALLNNNARRTLYFISKRQNATIVFDEDINRKVSVARTAYSSNLSMWTYEWISNTPIENRIKLAELLTKHRLGIDCEMPRIREKGSVIDGVGIKSKVIDGNGYMLAYMTDVSDGWRLGKVMRKFSD